MSQTLAFALVNRPITTTNRCSAAAHSTRGQTRDKHALAFSDKYARNSMQRGNVHTRSFLSAFQRRVGLGTKGSNIFYQDGVEVGYLCLGAPI